MRVQVRLLQLHDLMYLTIIIMQNSTQAQMLQKGSYYHGVTDLIYCAKKIPQFHSYMVHNGGEEILSGRKSKKC